MYGGGNMTAMLVDKVKAENAEKVKAVAKRIVKEAPALADLSEAELRKTRPRRRCRVSSRRLEARRYFGAYSLC